MTKIFTKTEIKERRRHLRHNLTLAEAILWNRLKQKQMQGQRFLRQFSIDKFVVDFYCPNLCLAIEVDGDTHLTPEEKEYDSFRQKKIEELNISFLRFTNGEIYEALDWVIQTIEAKVKELMESKRMKNPPFAKGGVEENGFCGNDKITFNLSHLIDIFEGFARESKNKI